MTEQRFTARIRAIRMTRWRRIALAVLAVVVVAALVWLIWFSHVLAVTKVSVEGETTLTASQVRETARVPAGRPLARLDTASIEARVASMERVQAVHVSRSWPHGVTITIVERTPIAWVSVDGVIRALDRFGIDFRTYSKAPASLVEVQVTVEGARQRQRTLESVATLVQLIDDKDPALRKTIQKVTAASLDSIQLDLTGGRTVVWGSGADSAHKLEVLPALLGIKASRYDISAPDQPTTSK